MIRYLAIFLCCLCLSSCASGLFGLLAPRPQLAEEGQIPASLQERMQPRQSDYKATWQAELSPSPSILYLGEPSALRIVSGPLDSLEIECMNCEIRRKADDSSLFVVSVDIANIMALITLRRGEQVQTLSYATGFLPNPEVYINGFYGDSIRESELDKIRHIELQFTPFIPVLCLCHYFALEIQKPNGQVLKIEQEKKERFSPENRALLQAMQPGDSLHIQTLELQCPGDPKRRMLSELRRYSVIE